MIQTAFTPLHASKPTALALLRGALSSAESIRTSLMPIGEGGSLIARTEVAPVGCGWTHLRATTAPIAVTLVNTGLMGPPGTGGDGTAPTYTAATPITAFRAVALNADGELVHASAATRAHGYTVAGIASQAAATGATLAPVSAGPIVNPAWSWAPGPVLLGADGQLVQQLPVGALFSLVVGWGQGDRLSVRLGAPIYLRG